MQPYGKIGAIVGLALLAALLSLIISVPDRLIEVRVIGIRFQFALSLPWFMASVLALLVAAQSDAIIREHPLSKGMGLAYAVTFWPLPCLLTLFGLPFVYRLPDPLNWIGALAYPTLLATVLALQYASISSKAAAWTLTVLSSGAVYGLYRAITALESSGTVIALVLGISSGAMASSLLRTHPHQAGRTWGQAALMAVIIGQAGWALTFWHADSLSLSLFLLGLFYVIVSLWQQQAADSLSKWSVVQYGLVSLIGLGLFWHYSG